MDSSDRRRAPKLDLTRLVGFDQVATANGNASADEEDLGRLLSKIGQGGEFVTGRRS